MFARNYSRVAAEESTANGTEQEPLPQSSSVWLHSFRGRCWLFFGGIILGLFLGWLTVSGTGRDSPQPTPWDEASLEPTPSSLAATLQPTFRPITAVTAEPTPMPITLRPTTLQPTTNSPTPKPVFNGEYVVDEATKRAWTQFMSDREALVKGKRYPDFKNEDYEVFCKFQSQSNPLAFVTLVDFPPKPEAYPKSVRFDSATLRKHIRQFRAAMASFYHFTSLDEMKLGDDVSESSVLRIASALHTKLEAYAANPSKNPFKIVYGFQGTSVMSGQDNCYDNTLAPLMGRLLQHLFAPIHGGADIRNYGQNGANSPDEAVQLMCSPSSMGDLDLLHLWYPMVPPAQVAMRESFVRSWFSHSSSLAQMTMIDDIFAFENLLKAGFVSKLDWSHQTKRLNWFQSAGEAGGLTGDGFCRMKTREGAAGIIYQNWHLGPMGHQFQADGLIMLIAKAAEQALEWLDKGRSAAIPVLPALPKTLSQLTNVECADKCGHRQCTNMNEASTFWGAIMCDQHAPILPPVACAWASNPQFTQKTDLIKTWLAKSVRDPADMPQAEWKYFQSKPKSSIHNAREAEHDNYDARSECKAFLDTGFSFKIDSIAGSVATEWIEVTWNAEGRDSLKGMRAIRPLICYAQHYPMRPYWMVFPPGWAIEMTIKGSPVGKPYPIVPDNMFYGCSQAYDGDPVPIPSVGSKLAFRFRRVNSTAEDPKDPLVVGAFLFFSSP